MIASGKSSHESAFLDASESGDDVFFLTADQLVPPDTDTEVDIYDAHECTTQSPCIPPPAGSPRQCEGDACQSPPPQPGIFGAPASSTFNGPGNLTPATAVKAKAKPLTSVQKLAAALKVCKRDKSKKRRVVCEKVARRRHGAVRKRTKA